MEKLKSTILFIMLLYTCLPSSTHIMFPSISMLSTMRYLLRALMFTWGVDKQSVLCVGIKILMRELDKSSLFLGGKWKAAISSCYIQSRFCWKLVLIWLF